MRRQFFIFLITIFLILPVLFSVNVEAANQNLFVSAENSMFDNHFAGSMVIEVMILDPSINDIDNAVGEPNVSINGADLRMVQTTDGAWYAYFANKEKAQIADGISFNGGAGVDGEGLDFGLFCGPNTGSSVLGISISDSEGVAVPRTGLMGTTNGEATLTSCTGTLSSTASINNVVRQPTSINTVIGQPGQIGLDPNAWPLIQLFSFSDDVKIKYNRAGGTQEVVLQYDEIPNISLELDRTGYPNGAEVFVTVNDLQLNQDPTDEDSWTFNSGSTIATFYQAFTETGSNSANGGPGLINLVPHLSNLDFEGNGKLIINLGSVAELKINKHQPVSSVTDGTSTFSDIVTLVESNTNSATFESFDTNNESTLGILDTAPRGQSAIIDYNGKSNSVITGTFTASISLNSPDGKLKVGQKTTVTLVDIDQNINSASKDDLDVFRSSAIIPTLQIGNPVTLQKTSNLKFYSISTDPLTGGTPVSFSVPDKNSDRLIIDTTTLGTTAFEKISLNLGIAASTLQSLLIDANAPNSDGTNAINFDLRSFEEQLDIESFSDTSMTLHFGGLPGTTIVQILDPGDISSAKDLVKIDDVDITTINTVSSPSSVFLEINFDSSNDTPSTGTISSETDTQPIVFDLFSIGAKNSFEINNGIYRLELEETSSNSGTFTGTVEYTVTNQLTLFDPNLLTNIRSIDDQIHLVVNNELKDEEGINIVYSDIAAVGVTIDTSSKTDIKTNSGTIYTGSPTLNIGHPVVIILTDPDLNLKNDLIDSYFTIDDPNSPNVDTVGSGGDVLVEVKINDVRYQRCTINGVEHGGLASTGFALIETGPNTGIFEGIFKMPSQICDKAGIKLITTAGGSLDVKYHDFRDAFGEQNIFSLSSQPSSYLKNLPKLNSEKFVLPKYKQTTDVMLTGKLSNYKQGTSVLLTLIGPDKSSKDLNVYATKNGDYNAVITLYHDSQPGTYIIDVKYLNLPVGSASFQVMKHKVPDWIKNNARWWSSDTISDGEFIGGIEHLIKEEIIIIPQSANSENSVQEIPDWIKNTANWWSEGLVSDDEFVSALEFLVKNSIIRI